MDNKILYVETIKKLTEEFDPEFKELLNNYFLTGQMNYRGPVPQFFMANAIFVKTLSRHAESVKADVSRMEELQTSLLTILDETKTLVSQQNQDICQHLLRVTEQSDFFTPKNKSWLHVIFPKIFKKTIEHPDEIICERIADLISMNIKPKKFYDNFVIPHSGKYRRITMPFFMALNILILCAVLCTALGLILSPFI